MKKIVVNRDFHYFQHGSVPTLIIHSGTHGDETSVTPHLESWIHHNYHRMPSFIFVPTVSPSACRRGTRFNDDGQDLNRIFTDNSPSSEVNLNQSILKDISTKTIISFHEDREYPEFYLYDDGFVPSDSNKLGKLFETIKSLGVKLLNGVDDLHDEALFNTFVDGYHFLDAALPEFDRRTVTGWCLWKGIASHSLIPEIPTAATDETKERLVSTLMEYVIEL